MMESVRTVRVGFDAQGFGQRFGGVSRYFCEMIRRLPESVAWELPFATTHNEYLTQAPYSKRRSRVYGGTFLPWMPLRPRQRMYECYKVVSRVTAGLIPSEEVSNADHVRKMVDSSRFDLIHFTGPHWLGPEWRHAIGRIPFVVTIHDLIPEIHGGQEGAVAERKDVLAHAAHVIAVSQHTKKDLVRLYDVAPSKITVIYHGRGTAHSQVSEVAGLKKGGFVLFVGQRSGYKNWHFMVQAIAGELIRHDLTLVCAGSLLTDEERLFVGELGVADRIVCAPYDDAELAWLYANAFCLVYPSKYEGFGLPILEAFARECPVVCSRCSCFPEIAGDGALYFEDGDADACRRAVNALFDGDVRRRVIAVGNERKEMFSWERCARQHAEVYHRVLAAGIRT